MGNKNKHNQSVGSEVVRTNERIDSTGEVFTPDWLCKEMVESIPLKDRMNPDSKFMDNSAGSGNFLVALRDELVKYHSLDHVLNFMLYSVELMEDNHKELCDRLGVSTTHPHYVNTDSLNYHYKFDGTPTEGSLNQFV